MVAVLVMLDSFAFVIVFVFMFVKVYIWHRCIVNQCDIYELLAFVLCCIPFLSAFINFET